jgi:hypothetical protein
VEENIQHILISCVLAWQIWKVIFQKLDRYVLLLKDPIFSSLVGDVAPLKGGLRGSHKGPNSLIILVGFIKNCGSTKMVALFLKVLGLI